MKYTKKESTGKKGRPELDFEGICSLKVLLQ
jgi:hypothetical protein